MYSVHVLLDHHRDGFISTSALKKTNHAYRYLDFASHHPLAQKLAVICTLQHSTEVLSSTQEAHDEQNALVADALLKKGYPRWLVCQYSNPPEKVAGRVDEQLRATISLPYVHGVCVLIQGPCHYLVPCVVFPAEPRFISILSKKK